MVKATFILQDGASRPVEVPAGTTVKEAAEQYSVPGILGLCGGTCTCGTCHVYVGQAWLNRFPQPSESEEILLDGVAAERRPSSRLGCQLQLTDEMDGIELTMPDLQQ
jgi:2Fe-2S ferredoxin